MSAYEAVSAADRDGEQDSWACNSPVRLTLCLLVLVTASAIGVGLTAAVFVVQPTHWHTQVSAVCTALPQELSDPPLRLRSVASTTTSPPLPTSGRTLVLYVHSENDGEHRPNLLHFIERAIRCWQHADYRIVVQRDDLPAGTQSEELSRLLKLPALPPNARYVLHKNECFDWGTAGWLLSLPQEHVEHVRVTEYRYFIIMNSSVRGPLLPSWLHATQDLQYEIHCDATAETADKTVPSSGLLPWFTFFIQHLDDDTKLFGSTINCQEAAHVQGYMVAIDFIALQLLWQVNGWAQEPASVSVEHDFVRWTASAGLSALTPHPRGPFGCHGSYMEAVWQNEIGASQAVIKAGYNIGALQLVWKATDFREVPDPCAELTNKQNPTELGSPVCKNCTELLPLLPAEVLFLKHKASRTYVHDHTLAVWLTLEESALHVNVGAPRRTPLFDLTEVRV